MHMKDPSDRTKVILRQLPPGISQSALMEQVDARFAGRYRWFCFRPGRNSQKNQRYARAYVDFNTPEAVVEFAEFFDGHVFVNEKGTQFKAIVEYAPSQLVPKQYPKKDGREGTIFKDPEYLEFLDHLAKPLENLPSAEIQLERKEAEERAGGPKDTLVVTPLMDFVRQKRAAKIQQRQSTNGKLSRRAAGLLPSNANSASTKRSSDKRRASASKYVLRESRKNSSGKEKSTYLLVQRHGGHQQMKPVGVDAATKTEISGVETVSKTDYGTECGVSAAIDPGRKRLLLKGKEKEISLGSASLQQQQNTTAVRNPLNSNTFKQSHRCDVNGRVVKSILSNKEARHNSSTAPAQTEQRVQTLNLEKEKRPPRPTSMKSILKDNVSVVSDSDTKRALDDKAFSADLHNVISGNEKQDRRTRNKDRPDRVVWTPLRRSDGLHASDESLSSSVNSHYASDSFVGALISQQSAAGVSKSEDDAMENAYTANISSLTGGKPKTVEGSPNYWLGGGSGSFSPNEFTSVEMKGDMPNARIGELKVAGNTLINGSPRHIGRRGQSYGSKEIDGSPSFSEGKSSKRGGSAYGSHEKQVWVQKSG